MRKRRAVPVRLRGRRAVQISSKRRTLRAWQAVAIIATAGALACSIPASAQIMKTSDEHGKTVYVNADSPKPRHGSTISSATVSSPSGTSVSKVKLVSAFPGNAPAYAEPKPFSEVTLAPQPVEIGRAHV